MTHIETIGNAILYLGDCREILPTLGTVDAIVTDPPYGTSVCTNGGLRSRAFRPYDPKCLAHVWEPLPGDAMPFDPSSLLAVHNLVLWGANNYASRLPDSACWFSWDKKTERGADSKIGDCELAWTRGLSFKTIRAFRHMWAGFQRDSEVGEKHWHPTQKPVALMRWCVEFFPEAHDIADPFMGSGTTGVACIKLGRKFIGIEIEPKYFDIACRRIEEATRQPDMFIEAAAVPKQESWLDAEPRLPRNVGGRARCGEDWRETDSGSSSRSS